MKKILAFGLLILAGLIILPLVQSISYTFKQFEPATIKVSCFNGTNSFCADDTTCLLTVISPDSTDLIKNVTMDYQYNYYNYSLTGQQTSILGEYSAIVACQGKSDGYTTFTYEVTTTGLSSMKNILPIFLLILSFLFLVLALVTKQDYVGFVSGILFIISGVYLMIYGLENIASVYTRGMAMVVLGFGLIVIIVSGYETISELGEEED